MDKAQAAIAIIEKALPSVPFDGWSMATLQNAAVAAGYKRTDVIRIFPGGAIDAVDAFIQQGDARLLETLQGYNLETMKIRERVATAVRLRISGDETHREAVRKATALEAMPFNAHRALRNLYQTVDTIWYAIGDTSTDFNFYTKRMMLAAVYASTLLYWLDDKSPGFTATWEFLDRRIENVMTIEKAKYSFKQRMKKSAPSE